MQSNNYTEQELVRQYLDGNEAAFNILLSRHKQRVFTQIIVMVKNEDLANDIFQDTFIKVINTLKKGKYNEEGKFLPWVLRIAHNLTIDHFRKQKKMPAVRSDENHDVFATLQQDDMNVEEKMVEEQIHEDVRNLLDLLPEEQREVVVMRHYAGMSFKEISEHNNVSINTSLGRMRYALINLRKQIDKNKIILTK